MKTWESPSRPIGNVAQDCGDFVMSPQVDAILRQIGRLDEEDRFALDQMLQDLTERAWRREAEDARSMARQQGIDQGTINKAADDLRYGS